MIGGKGGEGVVDLLDEGEHGGFELALVDGLAGVEPEAVVVAGEAAEELEGFGREVAWHLFGTSLLVCVGVPPHLFAKVGETNELSLDIGQNLF